MGSAPCWNPGMCCGRGERCKIAICGLSPATSPPTISEAQSIKLQGEGVLGKKRLAGDTARAASSDEVKDLRREASALRNEYVVSPLSLDRSFCHRRGYRPRYGNCDRGTIPGRNPDSLWSLHRSHAPHQEESSPRRAEATWRQAKTMTAPQRTLAGH